MNAEVYVVLEGLNPSGQLILRRESVVTDWASHVGQVVSDWRILYPDVWSVRVKIDFEL